MSDFATSAELTLTTSQSAIRSVRQEIEAGLSDVQIGLSAGGGGGGQPRDPDSGQFMAIEGVEQRLVDQTSLIEEQLELDSERNALLSADGQGGGRGQRRERQEFRWARERTEYLEELVDLVDDIDGGEGGGSFLDLGGVGAGIGVGVAGFGVGAAGLGVGAGLGAASAGEGVGSAFGDIGAAVADRIGEGEDLFTFAPVLEPAFEPSFDFAPVLEPEFNPDFAPVFQPEFSPRFDPQFEATFSPNVNLAPDVRTSLEQTINFSPSMTISPTANINIELFQQEIVDEAVSVVESRFIQQLENAQDNIESTVSDLRSELTRGLR